MNCERIILGDRNIDITLQRAWASLSTWEKLKFIFLLLWGTMEEITPEDVEKLKNSDMLTEMILRLSKEFPSLQKVLIEERDAYMAFKLLQEVNRLKERAVRKELEKIVDQDINETNKDQLDSNQEKTRAEISHKNTENCEKQFSSENKQSTVNQEENKNDSSRQYHELNNAIVAVVGLGHAKGIRKYFENPEQINMKVITSIPKSSGYSFGLIWTIIKTVLPLFVCYALYRYVMK